MTYTYDEIIERIQNSKRFGQYTGYEVSLEMLDILGNPQEGIPFIHVAGTNGKGSTTAFLCKILEYTGKRIGMFTSPHLINFEERIRINGTTISQEDVCRLGNILLNTDFPKQLTMFDYCLGMAVMYFKEQQVDLMVMETGIGGRYDSTNALGIPEVAVITKIGLDHTGILGDTPEAIAGEKAGIIKKGCYVVTTEQGPVIDEVINRRFEEVNQRSLENGQDETEPESLLQRVSGELLKYVSDLPRKMLGGYQTENAATAVLAAQILMEKYRDRWNLKEAETEQAVSYGVANTVWKGRMELMNRNPFFLIDGAHNSHGVIALRDSLTELYPGENFHFIMGVMADKDYEDMIEALLPLALDFVTVTPESTRAMQGEALAECIRKKGVAARHCQSLEEAVRPFLPTVRSRDHGDYVHGKTVAFGSLYFIGAIEEIYESQE